jgi:allantoicase
MWMLLKTKKRVIKRVGKRVSRGEWLKGWEKKKKKKLHSLGVLLSQ